MTFILSQWDRAVQMEGGLIKLTWVSVKGKLLCILFHMRWIHWRNESLVWDKNGKHQEPALLYPIYPTHAQTCMLSCTDLKIEMEKHTFEWISGGGGFVARVFFGHNNFILWWCMNATKRSHYIYRWALGPNCNISTSDGLPWKSVHPTESGDTLTFYLAPPWHLWL